ncbi:MAG: hypothetical protein HY695_14330 [Deltaproteobacteria bacterium]|nr:hypothetical protein [Deltaproteobacteria bacterium]
MVIGVSFFEDFVDAADALEFAYKPAGSDSQRLNEPGGVIRLLTPTSQYEGIAAQTVTKLILARQFPSFGGLVRLPEGPSGLNFFFGFSDFWDLGEYSIGFSVDNGSNWKGYLDNGTSASSTPDFGIPVTSSFVELSATVEPNQVRFFIDGVVVGEVSDRNLIPSDPAHMMRFITRFKTYGGQKKADFDNWWFTASR